MSVDHVAALIDRNFARSGAELSVGGVPVSALADEFGTPLFVYAGDVMDRQWTALRAALPPRFDVCYSVKANPHPAILRRFLARGAGLEIASAGELHLALAAGCAPERILFAGPGKTDTELELALKHGVGEIHVESVFEIQRVGAIARRFGATARVAIRVNPTAEAQGGAMRMGGKAAPFGIDEEDLEGAIAHAVADGALDVGGVHLFSGTQVLDATTLLTQWRKGVDVARRAGAILGRPLRTLDLGGGLGIPYFANEHPLDLAAVGGGAASIVADTARDPWLATTRFVVEPGRFLVGEAGVYVARVTDVKLSRGKRFLILDGGMHHHLAASGNLGQVIKRNFPLAVATRLTTPTAGGVDVVGPLCTPLDTLARDLALPAVVPGDLVAVFQSGASARAASPLGFLSHATPPEVLVDDGRARLIRRRGTSEDLVADLVAES